jgi:PAS domain S-box-containing protein
MTETADLKSIFEHDEKFRGLMNRLFEIALTHSFDAMMITENKPEYPVVFVNQSFTRITGYSNEDLVGRSPSVLQGPKTDRAVLDRLREDLAAGRMFHGVAVNYRKDGSEFLMEWKIAPVKDEREEITHFLAIQRDVSVSTDRPA